MKVFKQRWYLFMFVGIVVMIVAVLGVLTGGGCSPTDSVSIDGGTTAYMESGESRARTVKALERIADALEHIEVEQQSSVSVVEEESMLFGDGAIINGYELHLNDAEGCTDPTHVHMPKEK